LASVAEAAKRVKQIFGFTSYRWLEFVSFRECDIPWPFTDDFVRMDWLSALWCYYIDAAGEQTAMQVGNVLEKWADKYQTQRFPNAVLVRVGSGLAANLAHGVGNWFYSVAISKTGKLPRRSKFINKDPSAANLQRFKALEP
jgi:hypothetical protein